MLILMPMLISFTMVTTTGTTASRMLTGVARREKQQPRRILTMATMDIPTMAIIPIMAMATGEERRGQLRLFLIPSLLLIQTPRLMPTMVTMATGAGTLLTMGTLGHTTTDTTGAKHKRLSQELDL